MMVPFYILLFFISSLGLLQSADILCEDPQPSLPFYTSSSNVSFFDRRSWFLHVDSLTRNPDFSPFYYESQSDFVDVQASATLRFDGKVSNEVIVRFTSYKYASEHRLALHNSMQSSEGWNWIERVNPASAFPTDFALLVIEEHLANTVLGQLNDLNFVKDVSPQSRFTRALLMEDETGQSTRDFDESMESKSFGFQGNGANHQRRGKKHTPWSDDGEGLFDAVSLSDTGRKLLLQRSQITSMFEAEKLWEKGFTGAKVRMAVFDTGIRADHPHFRNIKERTNWTNEDTLNDNLGHGTFVAGVISSKDPQCLGFAPDADIYAFRVFTDAQVSYTSWFLDAFNYAIAIEINILNLSIGGPDFLDRPFIEKVWEMTANNVIMVSAIGNDGPLYGTLNNPADQSDVIGVGGIDYSDHIASFSSRGMTTWEIPHGYGRVKPDIVAYGRDIIGSRINSGCKSLSGTSVASPVVAGAVCLLASVIPEPIRWNIINPASMKQALIEGASRLDGPNIFEQGAGRLNLLESYEILVKYKPRASLVPAVLDFLDCPYMWPFCRQPLYAGAMPVVMNVTILNGMCVVGYVEESPRWKPSDTAGNLLEIQFTYSDVIWPWTGFLGIHMQVRDEGVNFSGIIEGEISVSVVSPSSTGHQEMQRSECTLHVRVNVIPTPQREQRILWDQFHNVRYPPGYIPRDSLDIKNDILDWHGDHPHTNFHSMFNMLRDAGYYLEILGSPFTCFDARQYGTLLMVDLEDEYFEEEKLKLEDDVKNLGLGLIVFADWYHLETMTKMKFFDDNTRSWWTPVTGGANIPAINDLLLRFGISFGGTILSGPFSIDGERGFIASGTDIATFPEGGFVHRFMFQDGTKSSSVSSSMQTSLQPQVDAAVLGAADIGLGRIAVYGDSNCLDSSHMVTDCYWLLKKFLDFTSHNLKDPVIFAPSKKIYFPMNGPVSSTPQRRSDVNFSIYSLVLNHELLCGIDSRFEVQGQKGYEKLLRSPVASGQRHPKGNDRDIGDNMLVILPSNKTMSRESDLPDSKGGKIKNQERKETLSQQREGWQNSEIESKFGWLHHDELDSSALQTAQWLIAILPCIAGFVLVVCLWRMQQKRRKRARKRIYSVTNFLRIIRSDT